jgi:NADPH:quinone reductase-like Zn-dependent oxidoreductase
MKAIVCYNYGPPDVLRYEDVEKPTPGAGEVLLKIRAAAVNPWDWHMMRGSPALVRLVAGARRPKDRRTGADVAGQVEAVGANVTRFKPGDEVFGVCRGAFAEYACAAESTLVAKPAGISFEQAAAAPMAALSALQALRDKGRIEAGHRVLINGAAGGVGTFAVQIAKAFGAEVTGVCSGANVDMVRSIGADRVVDYTREDFTRSAERYDILLDCIGNHSLSERRRILNPNGTCVLVGGKEDGGLFGPLVGAIGALAMSLFVSQRFLMFLAKVKAGDLAVLADLMAAGKIAPVIDRRYPLSEVPAAIRYLETGHARGKVVIV